MSDKNKSDKKIRSLLDKTSESMNREMASRKENVWASLEINQAAEIQKNQNRNLGWLWFLVGILLSMGGLYLQKQIVEKPVAQPPLVDAKMVDISNDLTAQIETFKTELADIKSMMRQKNTMIDSLQKSNKALQLAFNSKAVKQQTKATATIEYRRDTIYKTQIKEQQVIVEKLVEKIIRDTVFIEHTPLETLPFVELEDAPDETMTTSTEPVINPKCSKRSVQFNFK